MKKIRNATLLFLIKKSQGEITDICLAMKKRGFGMNRWNGVGGKVDDQKETIEDAAKRETKEEIGLDITIINKLGHFTNKNVRIHVYDCETNSTEYDIDTEESLEGGWYKISNIQKMRLIPKLKIYLE